MPNPPKNHFFKKTVKLSQVTCCRCFLSAANVSMAPSTSLFGSCKVCNCSFSHISCLQHRSASSMPCWSLNFVCIEGHFLPVPSSSIFFLFFLLLPISWLFCTQEHGLNPRKIKNRTWSKPKNVETMHQYQPNCKKLQMKGSSGTSSLQSWLLVLSHSMNRGSVHFSLQRPTNSQADSNFFVNAACDTVSRPPLVLMEIPYVRPRDWGMLKSWPPLKAHKTTISCISTLGTPNIFNPME